MATLSITAVGLAVTTVGLWFGVPVILAWLQSGRIQRICRQQKMIALTFDDGPDPDLTETVLEMLDELGVKATFFMIGSLVEEHEELAQRVMNEGHQIGGHTQHHLGAWRVGPIRGIQDCRRGMESLRARELGVTWFRPPRGQATLGTIMTCWILGCRMIWWTHDSGDTGHGSRKSRLNPMRLMRKLIMREKWKLSPAEAALPRHREALLCSLEESGGVVLLHDGRRTHEEYKRMSLQCTRDIVMRAGRNGFRFVTLDELTRG